MFCQLDNLPSMVQGVWSENAALQLEAMIQFRKLLSIGIYTKCHTIWTFSIGKQSISVIYDLHTLFLERNPPIEEVIKAGVVPRFVEFLSRHDTPQLQVYFNCIFAYFIWLGTLFNVDNKLSILFFQPSSRLHGHWPMLLLAPQNIHKLLSIRALFQILWNFWVHQMMMLESRLVCILFLVSYMLMQRLITIDACFSCAMWERWKTIFCFL